MVASGPVTFSKILAKICCHVYPMPNGCTSGCLYSAIRRPDINAWLAARVGLPLDNQSTKVFTLVHSLVLSSPNSRSHPCSAFKSVTPRQETPESLRATNYTSSSVVSVGIKIVVSPYISNVAQEGNVLLRCFPSKTDEIVSLIVPIQS